MAPAQPWGKHTLPLHSARSWQIGPLSLWVCSQELQWRVATWHDEARLDELHTEPTDPELPLPEHASLHRFATDSGQHSIGLRPLSADRPVVARPEVPLGLPPGHQATFYMSTPAWVEVSAGDHPLLAVPTSQLSDTWFGASTREGQLCYASRTQARLLLDQLPKRPGRVVTEVRVRNQGTQTLALERVQIPLPHLALHRTTEGVLWTPSVTVVLHPERADAEVRIAPRPPAAAGGTTPHSEARQLGAPSFLVRALGALLS